jgi:hypothetical protein
MNLLKPQRGSIGDVVELINFYGSIRLLCDSAAAQQSHF